MDVLAFVHCSAHRDSLAPMLREAERDPEVVGLMVHRSVARGEASPLSDLDMFVLLADGATC